MYEVPSKLDTLGRLDGPSVTASSWRVWILTNGHQYVINTKVPMIS